MYSVHRWPCCSGTLPQVVADYGINSYFHEPGALWVNLYMPGEVRWNDAGAQLLLTQDGTYPADGQVRMHIKASRPIGFALKLRIPEFAGVPDLKVNGKPMPLSIDKGFCEIRRVWRPGDTVTLTMAMPLRLEALPVNGGPGHPEAVALLYGPIVLFALRAPGEIGSSCRAARLAAQSGAHRTRRVDSKHSNRHTTSGAIQRGRRPLYTLYLQGRLAKAHPLAYGHAIASVRVVTCSETLRQNDSTNVIVSTEVCSPATTVAAASMLSPSSSTATQRSAL